MAAKKEIAKKKNIGKKEEIKKKNITKISKEISKPAAIESVDLEKFKDENGAYDLTNSVDSNTESTNKQLNSNDEVIVAKTEVVNGDQSVLKPVEPIDNTNKQPNISEPIVAKNEEKKINKITKKINQNFGYLWNGQMIDF